MPGIRTCPAIRSKVTCCGWLENCGSPASYSEQQLEELDQLVGPWIDDYQRTSRTTKK